MSNAVVKAVMRRRWARLRRCLDCGGKRDSRRFKTCASCRLYNRIKQQAHRDRACNVSDGA